MQKFWKIVLLSFCLLSADMAFADKLAHEANKAFRKIGISPSQTEPYAVQYEKYLKSRNMAVRRVLNKSAGGEVSVKARKAVNRAAKRAVKKMKGILTEQQLKYYEEYLLAANKVFLRDSGLRH